MKRTPPVTYQAFMGEAATRQRYWARSLLGWPRFGLARPNGTHQALAALESRGKLQVLLTQNVDGLHQRAGSRNVIDLHGRLDLVRCMCCERRSDRGSSSSACWTPTPAGHAGGRHRPDGDADLRPISPASWYGCRTAAVLKPDVVFFGENVPRERVEAVHEHLQQADAVLVVARR